MKISWVLLTFNRSDAVAKSVLHNISTKGVKNIDELIWVDNGSFPYEYEKMERAINGYLPVTKKTIIRIPENRGVSRGYNAGVALATGTHFLITGCDRLMPVGWLDRMATGLEIPNVKCVSIYSQPRDHRIEDRFSSPRDEQGWSNAFPFEARLVAREVYEHAGYFREDFGLYGWEDCEWAPRVLRVCKEKGWRTVTDESFVAQHITTENMPDYHAFKKRESDDPTKNRVLNRCSGEQWPYYNPWSVHTDYSNFGKS